MDLRLGAGWTPEGGVVASLAASAEGMARRDQSPSPPGIQRCMLAPARCREGRKPRRRGQRFPFPFPWGAMGRETGNGCRSGTRSAHERHLFDHLENPWKSGPPSSRRAESGSKMNEGRTPASLILLEKKWRVSSQFPCPASNRGRRNRISRRCWPPPKHGSCR